MMPFDRRRQRRQVRRVRWSNRDYSTQGMYGDLHAVTGRSLPAVAALELPEAIELPQHDGAAVSV